MEPTELLERFATILEQLGIPYFVTGSMASIYYGEPRFTNDIDVVVQLGTKDVDAFCRSFPSPDFYLSPAAVRDAVLRCFQFNIIHTVSGLKIDVIIPHDTDFEKSRQLRVTTMTLANGKMVRLASAEDIILRKMEYYQEGGSEKHLRDIASILRIQKEHLDRTYISEWTQRLGVEDIWNSIVAKEAQA